MPKKINSEQRSEKQRVLKLIKKNKFGEKDAKLGSKNRNRRFKKKEDIKNEKPKRDYKNDKSKCDYRNEKTTEKFIKLPKAKYDEKSLTITFKKGKVEKEDILKAYRNHSEVDENEESIILKYNTSEHARVDMKANRRGKKTEDDESKYFDNKYLLLNLSYKANEEAIRTAFEKYGEIEKIKIKTGKENISKGVAEITFKKRTIILDEIILNNKIVQINRIKKVILNKKRIFIGGLHKKVTLVGIRQALTNAGCRPDDIRIKFTKDNKNLGYGFISYEKLDKAKIFEEKFESFKNDLGQKAYYEYSQEKSSHIKKSKK